MTETLQGGATMMGGGSVQVHRATVDDVDAVIELRVALLREYRDHPVYGQLRPDAELRARPVFEQQLRAPDQVIFLAVSDGHAIGLVRCADVKSSPLLYPDRYCYVTSVYVRPEYRRQGLLSLLMEHAEFWARGRGLTEMRLHNSTMHGMARGAWDQLGFAVNEEVRLKRLKRLGR
jgi:GNAT superfamily N-acetyltransferase